MFKTFANVSGFTGLTPDMTGHDRVDARAQDSTKLKGSAPLAQNSAYSL